MSNCNHKDKQKPIIVSNVNKLNWKERYDMAVEKGMRLPTSDEIIQNKSEFEKNGDYWIAIGTPTKKGWIQIGNLHHFYGKLHMTSLCDYEFTQKLTDNPSSLKQEDYCPNRTDDSTDIDEKCYSCWNAVGR